MTANVGRDEMNEEPLGTASGSANWCGHRRNWYGDFSEKNKNGTVINTAIPGMYPNCS